MRLLMIIIALFVASVLTIRLYNLSKIEQRPKPSVCEAMADTNYVVLTLAEYKKMDSVVAIVLNK